MKNCEVCGRTIITGRKYCFKHRNTIPDNISKQNKIIKNIEQDYIGFFINKEIKKLNILQRNLSGYLNRVKKKAEEEAIDNIVNKREDYVQYAKSYISIMKEEEEKEKEFNKTIFEEA